MNQRQRRAAVMRAAAKTLLLTSWSLFALGFGSLEKPAIDPCTLPLDACQVVSSPVSETRSPLEMRSADSSQRAATAPSATPTVPPSASEVRKWTRPFR